MREDILKEYELRVDEQLKWFEAKAYQTRRMFLVLRTLQTILLTILSGMFVLSASLPSQLFTLVGTVLSLAALLTTTFLQLSNYDSQWQQYRLVAEQLQKERRAFQLQIGEYSKLNDEETRRAYMERIESVLQSENSRWFVGVARKERA